MARRRQGRALDGILVLDKPTGMTSNAALQTARRWYSAAKAGHTGSLDPLATGVLPICFGEATKFSQYLLDADKAYRSTFVFGVTMSTGDADGEELTSVSATGLSEQQIVAALPSLTGNIEQVPPMYSALKRDGQPLYKLARAGQVVEREPRPVTVHEFRLLAFRAGERAEADVYIRCSKGTYVRTLAEDLGERLGCGAHVKTLHRVQAGPFHEEMAVALSELERLRDAEDFAAMDALLQPLDSALGHLPTVTLSAEAASYIVRGQAVRVRVDGAETVVKLKSDAGVFLGIGEVLDDGRVAPRRLLASD